LFAVDLARKDARHAMALAEAGGARMKNVELADSYLKVVKEQQGEKGDIAGIYGAKRVEAGLPFGNKG
jgi:3-hydroxyisobutyrate dehydrogenase-like beta-hydroxyacid dehydrogenase